MAFDALFTGITGLNAYQSWIDMISNNIANTATTGYKGQRMTFADLFYQQTGAPSGPTTARGGVDPLDQGLGVKVNTIDTEFAQGGLQTTGVNTDLALNGNGFFILRNVDGSSQPTYTRDGAFSLNSNGLLYDPASGLAVQGYEANQSGQITQTGTPGDITIPIGLQEQATATGQGVKVGPTLSDQNFDMQIGGNLDQTQWSQQFLNQIKASINPGVTKSISTTVYDSLGNAHQATITYTPDAAGATAATATITAGTGNAIISAAMNPAETLPPGATKITATVNAAGTAVNFTDNATTPNTVANATAGQTVVLDGVSMVVPPAATLTANKNLATTVRVTSAFNGLPSSVQDASGVPETISSRWQVSVSFTDGTTFQALKTPNVASAPGVVAGATFTTASSGVVGYAYFNQNGQFVNTSSIESVTAIHGVVPPAKPTQTPVAQAIGASDAAFLHSAGGGLPSITQGNQLNIVTWGPSAGNPALAPTAGQPTVATPGPIAIDFSENAALSGAYTANVISQNGYAAGTLSNITFGQDGTVSGAFTNGQTKTLAQLALATFQNEQGLTRIGGNQFTQTAASGLAELGTAASGSFGNVVSGSLEQSNVNLADEFTNLIVAQRAFEANSRGITTADQNLITLINLRASEN